MNDKKIKKVVIKANKHTGEELINTAKKLKVCAYARVSTDDDDQLNSYKAQLEHYKRMILEHENWEFVNLYGDEGASGTQSKNRIGFQKMLDDCRNGMIDLILVKQISRFGRNTMEGLSHIYELRNLGVEIYFETDNLYASDKKTDFLLQILFAIAQEESRNISARVTFGIHETMENGDINKLFTRSSGFNKDLMGNITIVPHEAYIFRVIANLKLNGISASSIEILFKKYENEPWYKKTLFTQARIHDISKNTKYAGDIICQKSFIEDYLTHKQKVNKGERDKIIYKNALPEIIPRWFYETCNVIMSKEERMSCFGPSSILRTLFYCGKCGSILFQTRVNQNRIFSNCPVGLRCKNALSKNGTCDQHSINFTSVITIVERYLEKIHGIGVDNFLKFCLNAVHLLDNIKGKSKLKFLKIYNGYLLNQEKLNLSYLSTISIDNSSLELDPNFISKRKKAYENIEHYMQESERINRELKMNHSVDPVDTFIKSVKDENRALMLLFIIRSLNVKIVELDSSNILFIKFKQITTNIEIEKNILSYLSKEKTFIETLPIIVHSSSNESNISYWTLEI